MDTISGTTFGDVFEARILDNSNTLQSGDKISGGNGIDRLNADIGNSQKFAITAETTSVEEVAIRAQAVPVDSNNNNLSENIVQIDAQRMKDVTLWESSNSRADVVIEDVRIRADQITKDITIAMVETDPGHVDFGVYFDQYSLRAQTNTSATLALQLMDTRSQAAGTGPLKDSPYNGFAFFLTAPGSTTPKLVTVQSAAIDAAQTYEDLVTAINVALKANPDTTAFTASLGAEFTVSDTLGSIQKGTTVNITATNGSTVSTTGAGAGWLAAGAVPPSSGLHTDIQPFKANTVDLVTSKVILDDVGRGSTGGDLVIGGLSVGDTSTSKGVERFEIEVRDNSKLQTINSTNNTLREVVIKNGETSSTSFAYVDTVKDAGNLTVNGTVGATTGKNEALPGTADQHNAFGFSDVKTIDGSAMAGKLEFTAEVTSKSIAKYLNLKDGAPALPAADNVAFVYTGGSANDTMNVVVDQSVIGSTNSLTGREDFTFTMDGGAGNDKLTLEIGGNKGAAWLANQKLLQNVTINGGAGNDTIWSKDAGSVKINAGEGNDTVYTDNIGTKATWVVGAANLDVADLQSSANAGAGTSFLYKGKVTVSFSGAAVGGGVTAAASDAIAAAFTNGFEVVADIPTGTNYAVNQYHVNQAIKAAINGNDVLNKLLVAEDGPGSSLVIKSLVDGTFAADDLAFNVTGVDVTTLSTSEQATVLTAYKTFAHDSAATIATAQTAQAASVTAKNGVEGVGTALLGQTVGVDITGSASTAESDNTINLGAGDDVLVLGTGANSNDKLVFTGYGQGKNTVVNFDDAVGTGLDVVDFTSYLNNTESASGSVDSQLRIATTLNADTTVEANSVTVLTGAVFTDVKTFAGLSASALLAAVNSTNTGSADYAGITAATLNAANTYTSTGAPTSLVGGIGKSIVLVQNDANEGEYAVFELTFNGLAANTTADFTAAQLVGVVDFGNSVDFSTAGLLV